MRQLPPKNEDLTTEAKIEDGIRTDNYIKNQFALVLFEQSFILLLRTCTAIYAAKRGCEIHSLLTKLPGNEFKSRDYLLV